MIRRTDDNSQGTQEDAQNPPALKIPGTGQRILQTDASDHYWRAIMIEQEGEKNY